MAGLRDVSDGTFDELVLQADRPILVDFWAEWCGPCRVMAPMLEALAEEQKDRLDVVKLDVQANPDVVGRLGIGSIPTLILFVGGQEAERLVGHIPQRKLVERVARHLP